MSTEIEAEPRARPPAHLWARMLLIAVAAVESLGVLSAFFVLSGDLSEVPGPGLGGWTILATLILRPVLAITALVFALRAKLPQAIMALGVVVLLRWLSLLPSFVLHGLTFEGSGDLYSSAHFLISPILAIAAMWVVWKDEHRPGLPAILVSLPTIVEWIGVIVFAISVMIYGF